jgi:hypothetical protein
VASLVALQLPAAHTVPAGCLRQLPAPSHFPSVPQLDFDVVLYVLVGSAAPAGTGAQLPRLPGTLQARQDPQGPLPQQTPSVHWPLAQSAPAMHAAPSALSLPHCPFTHVAPAQSASLAQLDLQTLAASSHL